VRGFSFPLVILLIIARGVKRLLLGDPAALLLPEAVALLVELQPPSRGMEGIEAVRFVLKGETLRVVRRPESSRVAIFAVLENSMATQQSNE
jgi:hypothetical protein